MKASIIIINYNDKLRIGRAIESALNQTYKDIEVIIVDDGSENAVRAIYEAYKGKIKLIQIERDDKTARTPSRARNAGMKEATGEYICFLDSDNYYENSFIESLIGKADISFCNWQIVGLENYKAEIEKIWKQKDILINYLSYTNLDHQCLLIKKSILDEVGLYDERLPRSQDCDMIVRLMTHTQNWFHVPEILFTFEKHEKDQMKIFASFHGKALWSLKNNINIEWLLDKSKKNLSVYFAVHKGINDFMTLDIWKPEREKGEYIKAYEHALNLIDKECKENGMQEK
jgi:glycosyltransferase involved in cell wall biosynthesis